MMGPVIVNTIATNGVRQRLDIKDDKLLALMGSLRSIFSNPKNLLQQLLILTLLILTRSMLMKKRLRNHPPSAAMAQCRRRLLLLPPLLIHPIIRQPQAKTLTQLPKMKLKLKTLMMMILERKKGSKRRPSLRQYLLD